MSILKKIAGQTAIYGLSGILGRFLNYLLVPLYTRVFIGDLGKAEYGISGEFFAYASLGGVLFTYGMETAFFRFSQKKDNKDLVFSTVLTSVIGSSVLLGLLLFAFATPLAQVTRNIGREAYFYCFTLILAADAVSAILFARLRQEEKAMQFVKLRFLSIGINIGLNLFFYLIFPWLTRHGLFAPLSSHEPSAIWMFVANVVASVAVLFFFKNEFKLLRTGFDTTIWKEMIIYGLPVLFMGFGGMINETFDRILLKQLIENQSIAEQQIGIYNANYKLSIIITLFIQAFRMAAEPFFFAQAKEEDSRKTNAVVMQYFMLICATLFVGIALYLDIFKYFIGESYWEGLKVVPILLLANVFLGAYYNLSVWYKLTDKTHLGAVVVFVGAAITLILNYLWIPKIGYEGSAWATLICYFSMAAISYFAGQKHYPIPYPTRRILAYLAWALTIYIISQMVGDVFNAPPSVSAVKSLIINTLLFGLYLFVVYKMEEKELRPLLKKIKFKR